MLVAALDHECMYHLERRSRSWVEPHGEPCYQEWLECTRCHYEYADEEVDRIIQQLEAQDDDAHDRVGLQEHVPEA